MNLSSFPSNLSPPYLWQLTKRKPQVSASPQVIPSKKAAPFGATLDTITGVSSVEKTVEKTDELIRQISEQRERDKETFCALLHITPEEFDRRYIEPRANKEQTGLSAMRPQ